MPPPASPRPDPAAPAAPPSSSSPTCRRAPSLPDPRHRVPPCARRPGLAKHGFFITSREPTYQDFMERGCSSRGEGSSAASTASTCRNTWSCRRTAIALWRAITPMVMTRDAVGTEIFFSRLVSRR
ncbi:hypothetical protein BRADI_5g08376v3 [Brachypodium distachyon]|uniref:Uncharacterized protein n=1 Tax=Brachypodium distachyon TaxID=15368 RepID=A0A0Q3GNE7_BRADI|nr:hypothetical protein BRADI_5g08376v3 [Brachypodium distachyon]